MTVQASNLQSEQLPDAGKSSDRAKVAGQSPTKLAVDRFRHDKLSMVVVRRSWSSTSSRRSRRRSW